MVEHILHALLNLVSGLLVQSFTVLLQENAQFFVDLVLGGAAAFVLAALALASLLLESFGITQRIEGVIGRAHAGTNARQHYDFDFVVRKERVTEHHSQLGLPEGHVLSLAALRLRRVQCADALLQTEQGLVNLGSLDLTVLVVALAVLGTLGAGQVNEQQFTARIDTLLLDFNLSDGVTAGRSVVGLGGVRCTHLVTLLDELED